MHRHVSKLVVMALACVWAAASSAEGLRIGGGAHYWRTVDSLDEPFDEDGLSPVVSLQVRPADLLALQLDLEFFPDGYAGSREDVIAPQAFAILGSGLYGGLGAGWLYSDGDLSDDPFFIIRAGIDLELLPDIHLDVNANYHFAEWEGINEFDERVDSDTITLGAAVRLDL